MIRVLWVVPNDPNWVAGLNYFTNLYRAILSVSNRAIEPIILGDVTQLPSPLCRCGSIPYPTEVKRTIPLRVVRKMRRIISKASYDNILFSEYLSKNKIDLLSHCQPLWPSSKIPSLCWIPDFQHHHLPHFFTPEEINERNKGFQHVYDNAHALVFSSEDARNDFNNFYPGFRKKTYVLHFVSYIDTEISCNVKELNDRYNIAEPYFHIPNQLWAHKNHAVVLGALRILKSRGHCPLVISTGQTHDYRNAGYFPDFQNRVSDAGLVDRFRFLGLISYPDVCALMRESVGIINPSFFEGWSTTVEEAKSLGKQILLSDIPVHREQNPGRGRYFNSSDSENLALLIHETIRTYDPSIELSAREKAFAELPVRILNFGRRYEEIVIDAAGK